MRQDAAAMAVLGQRDFLELPAFDARDAVMFRQPAVEHREIGVDEIGQAQVVLQQLLEEQIRLLEHRALEHVVVFGIEDVARNGGVDLAQVEPLADEVLGERRRLAVLEHAFDLRRAASPARSVSSARPGRAIRRRASCSTGSTTAGWQRRSRRALAAAFSPVSRRNRKSGDTIMPIRPTRTACSNDCLSASRDLDQLQERLDVVIASRPGGKRGGRTPRRMRSASASGSFDVTSTRFG